MNKALDGKHIALLYGGTSSEREVSLRSGAAVQQALINLGAQVTTCDPKQDSVLALNNQKVDCALIMLHGKDGEDGVIQGTLQTMDIAYTGCGVASSALAMDKFRTKLVWMQLGLATPQFRLVRKGDDLSLAVQSIVEQVGTEVMVKPVTEGSSVGMSRAQGQDDILIALEFALSYADEVIAEQYITGAEFTVAILKDIALPSIQLKTPNAFYDYQAKYESTTTEYLCPSGLQQDKELQIQQLALQAYRAIGCEGWGRVDVMQDSNGKFYLLEVNTVPGMTEKSLVPMAAKAAGISFDELVYQIVTTAGTK